MDRPLLFKKLPVLTQPVLFMVCLAALSGFSFFFSAGVAAQGDLLITPKRLVFEGSVRSIDLNLANTGTDTATYAVSVVQIRMTEDGGFETITDPDPGQLFADPFLRFFPRSVTLGPNEAQVVKVQVTRANELTTGEYRSHFYFRAIPKAKPLGEAVQVLDTNVITVQLTPVYGITIPAIIRSGQLSARVTLSDLSLAVDGEGSRSVKLVFNRTGNMSIYGDIAIDHISPQGAITRVGIANGVAVYTPNATRRFQVNLFNVPGLNLTSGKLRVTYSAPSDVKPEKYAEAEVLLGR
jgi:P pilus assembly chaperone PapD